MSGLIPEGYSKKAPVFGGWRRLWWPGPWVCPPETGQPLIIKELDWLHYTGTVLRAKPGQCLELLVFEKYLPVAPLVRVELLELQRRQASVRVLSVDFGEMALPEPPLTLAVALVKEQAWDFILQKATELGVTAIQPLQTEFTVVKLPVEESLNKIARWQTLTRQAALQSERRSLPELLPPLSLPHYLKQTFKDETKALGWIALERSYETQEIQEKIVGSATKSLSIFEAAGQWNAKTPLVIIIGPEGGWSPEEKQAFTLFYKAGLQPVSLGWTVLKAETAAITALATAKFRWDKLMEAPDAT